MPSATTPAVMTAAVAALVLSLTLGRGLVCPGRFARIVGGAGCGLVIVWAAQTLAGGGHG